jgi:hypothetical protein
MSGRLPVASGPPCGDDPASLWYEDLSAAGTGDDYHERTIKADPGSCAISKKVYNFTSVRTTVLTKGADYVVLKHWCDPTSSSSSSGVDDCCAQFTDYDMRCVGGVLQRWKKVTEVCWDGDCLVTQVISDWKNTGETAGCCDCGSGVDPSSSSTASSTASSSSGGGSTGDCICDNTAESVTATLTHYFTGRIGGVFTPTTRTETTTLTKTAPDTSGNCTFEGTGSATIGFDEFTTIHWKITVGPEVSPFTCGCSGGVSRTLAVDLRYWYDGDDSTTGVVYEECLGVVQALCPQTATCEPLCIEWDEDSPDKFAVLDLWSSGNLPDNYELISLHIGCGG